MESRVQNLAETYGATAKLEFTEHGVVTYDDPATAPSNHSPFFSPNERIPPLGMRTHALFAIRYLESGGAPAK